MRNYQKLIHVISWQLHKVTLVIFSMTFSFVLSGELIYNPLKFSNVTYTVGLRLVG